MRPVKFDVFAGDGLLQRSLTVTQRSQANTYFVLCRCIEPDDIIVFCQALHPLAQHDHDEITHYAMSSRLARARSVPFVRETTYDVHQAGWDPLKHGFVRLKGEAAVYVRLASS